MFCMRLFNGIAKHHRKFQGKFELDKKYNKKMKKIVFPIFHLLWKKVLIRILTWNFVWDFAMLLKSLMLKIKKIYPWNSNLCIVPSRFVRVKRFISETNPVFCFCIFTWLLSAPYVVSKFFSCSFPCTFKFTPMKI